MVWGKAKSWFEIKMDNNNQSTLRGDFFGGITTGLVVLPLALAFGVQSGMGAIAGLYGAIAIGILAAWFGGTPTQISGPTGPMTVVSAVVIATAIETAGSLENALGTIIAIFVLASIFQIVLGLLRIGQYIQYMPYPVVSGFMTGIGIIMIVLQIFPFLGHASPKRILDIFAGIPNLLPLINYSSVILALTTIAVIYLFPRISRIVPSPLVALIMLTFFSTALNLNVATIGDIPTGLPAFLLAKVASVDLANWAVIVMPALTLAALGAIDSLLTSVVADNMTRTKHNSNKELVGQGLGNMATAMIGGIPGAGATMRTVVNINSGGKTRLYGVIHGIALLVVLVGAGTYASLIPIPVLAGILITVGIGIVDYKGLKHLPHVHRADAFVTIVVLTLTVFVDLLQAVAVGMVLASILFMKKMSDIVENSSEISSIREFAQNSAWADESIIPAAIANTIYIKHLERPIFLGFASTLQSMARTMPEVKIVIIRMKRVPYIDQTGLYSIEDAVLSMRDKGITVLMTGVQGQPLYMLKKVGMFPDLVPRRHVFSDFSDCINRLQSGLIDDETASSGEKKKGFRDILDEVGLTRLQ